MGNESTSTTLNPAVEQQLQELVAEYGELDASIKGLTKKADASKASIKSLLTDNALDGFTAGGYKVSMSVSERESYDTDSMLKYLKADWVAKNGSMTCPYIKTQEYVDMEALENAIYTEQIATEVVAGLDKFRTVKEVVTLKCSKQKAK